jgi:hypothetical protein
MSLYGCSSFLSVDNIVVIVIDSCFVEQIEKKETFEFEKKYLEILDNKYLFDFSSFELATRNFRLSVADGKT